MQGSHIVPVVYPLVHSSGTPKFPTSFYKAKNYKFGVIPLEFILQILFFTLLSSFCLGISPTWALSIAALCTTFLAAH